MQIPVDDIYLDSDGNYLFLEPVNRYVRISESGVVNFTSQFNSLLFFLAS